MQIIKSILLWLLGVALGVLVLLGAVMAASYSFTTSGSAPDPALQFGGQALEVNGSCWQVPLIGGLLDKAFYAPSTLSVQKLGVLYEAHPQLTLPDWATGAQLTITADGMGDAYYFQGDISQYDSFLYPANGEYKAQLTVWRLPDGMTDADFRWPSDGAVLRNAGLERPAKPTGCYQYSFRFTIQASAQLELSAERIEQGGVAALEISGMVGTETPAVETDLGIGPMRPQPCGLAVLHTCRLQRLGGQPHPVGDGERGDPHHQPDRHRQKLRGGRSPARPARLRGGQRGIPERDLAPL